MCADDRLIKACLVRRLWDLRSIISSRVVREVQSLRGQIYIWFMVGVTRGRRIRTSMRSDMMSLMIVSTHEFGKILVRL